MTGERFKRSAAALAAAAMLAVPGAATAATPKTIQQGYGNPVSAAETEIRTPGAATQSQARRGTLPFTGFDLALLVLGGAALLALGTGIRWAGRQKA